jgi:hypothetical protein
MIEGLKVTVNAVELQQLCNDRVRHHSDRAEKYQQQIDSMKADSIQGMAYTNGDPVKALEDRRQQHESEAMEMNFIAAHIDMSHSYLLGREDLVKLGITKSRY